MNIFKVYIHSSFIFINKIFKTKNIKQKLYFTETKLKFLLPKLEEFFIKLQANFI